MRSFWKWSLLIFLAARSSDVVQSVIGLWLVPKCVPAADVGAILPMTQTAIMLSLPLTILMVPVSRWLTIYTVRGEQGKVKSLLRVALYGSLIAALVMSVLAGLFLPGLFRVARVSERGFSVVLLFAGALSAVAPVFDSALQGLRRFGTVVLAGFVAAPLRLLVTLALMPFRVFTGYMLGISVASLSQIAISWCGVRRDLSGDVPAQPFWREDGRAMLRYVAPIALMALVWNSLGAWQAMLIRTNLPDVENAAYFIITRFGDIGGWVGLSIGFVAFPTVACSQTKGEDALLVLVKSLLVTVLVGGGVAFAYLFLARPLMASVECWRDYAGYASCVPLWTVRSALGAAIGVFFAYEKAMGSFRFLLYFIPWVMVESAVLFFLPTLLWVIVWLVASEMVQVAMILGMIVRRRKLSR